MELPLTTSDRAVRLAEIQARAADNSAGDLAFLTDELARLKDRFDEATARNGELIEELSRLHHVHIHPLAGTFCRTCAAEVEDVRDGCPSHSPTRIVRALLVRHAELTARFTVPLDGPAPEADPEHRRQLAGERARLAVDLLDETCALLAPAMQTPGRIQLHPGHRPGCAPFDCRCGCPRGRACPDCRRCTCWSTECRPTRDGDDAATAGKECGTCGDTTCTAPGTEAHLYCVLCKWPHGEHRFVECDSFTPEAATRPSHHA
ncbi:hypothetical protein ACIQU4_28640 [Streptomyces sp. NPDC090741]|uniref:hypothetical protein n=1 Tax=Streptomyces sp. NPDC090741 TaxID=3365967 RepID=UPI00381BB510